MGPGVEEKGACHRDREEGKEVMMEKYAEEEREEKKESGKERDGKGMNDHKGKGDEEEKEETRK